MKFSLIKTKVIINFESFLIFLVNPKVSIKNKAKPLLIYYSLKRPNKIINITAK